MKTLPGNVRQSFPWVTFGLNLEGGTFEGAVTATKKVWRKSIVAVLRDMAEVERKNVHTCACRCVYMLGYEPGNADGLNCKEP